MVAVGRTNPVPPPESAQRVAAAMSLVTTHCCQSGQAEEEATGAAPEKLRKWLRRQYLEAWGLNPTLLKLFLNKKIKNIMAGRLWSGAVPCFWYYCHQDSAFITAPQKCGGSA